MYLALTKNIERNYRSNITALQIAVALERAILPFYKSVNSNVGMSSLINRPGSELEANVQCGPLQDYLTGDDWRRTRFIKIDVEGAEEGVIACIAQVIHLLPPDVEISVEIDGSDCAATTFRKLQDLGFRAFDLGSTYSLDDYLTYRPSRLAPICRNSTIFHRLSFPTQWARELKPD